MLSVLDRYILRSLLFNYLIALGTMLSLYVVLDVFVNMDEFTEHGYPTWTVMGHILGYYWPNLFLYFSQLSGVITLFACLTTLARMRKQNELTAVLASGVSLYRVARPILIFGVAITLLAMVDTEWVIPKLAHKLARDHDDAHGQRAYEVFFMADRDDALFSARQFHPTQLDIQGLLVLHRDEKGVVSALEADRAVWEPPLVDGNPGRWLLERGRRTRRIRQKSVGLGPSETKRVDYPVEYISDLSPNDIQMRQSEGWIRYLSLRQLADMKKGGALNRRAIVQTQHARRTAPIVSIILLLLGLPFFLNREPANILSDAGRCLLVCGLCYVATFVSQSLRPGTVSSLPAWIPIFIFGTLSIVLIDRIKT